ncbi:epoxide hydrolase family protein [Thalassospira marina]|uniref:Epoxide hydrolase n=1 Tax=Thalassospira marina TaxID=2048283 RepID=A0A2N3KMP4_9PROT|nr:epoxide hydrolase family protein [Thalassospira marina]PKR51829.1 epoxide hydrolase [Thalassospira marina]
MTPTFYPIHVAQDVLDDMVARIRATRWPDDPGNSDWSYGVEEGYLRSLARDWVESFDWRAVEARINAYDNWRVEIDGIPIHYLRIPGKGPTPKPLILTHGWPWSFWDMERVIGPLTDPAAHGGDPTEAFELIIPSLPGYGFSGTVPRAGLTFWQIADLWHRLMTDVLGFERYAASGGDWGALIASQLGHKYAESLYGIHIMHPMLLDQFGTQMPWNVAARAWDTGAKVSPAVTKFAAHFAVHVLDPQTMAYGLNDSPVGLLAWLLERWRAWGDTRDGDGKVTGDPERVFSREHMLANATIYWVTGTAGSSMRAYADAARYPWAPSHDRQPVVEAPVGITFLGGENPPGVKTEDRAALFASGPRASFFNTVYMNAHARGGHFGYYENPEAVVQDLQEVLRQCADNQPLERLQLRSNPPFFP